MNRAVQDGTLSDTVHTAQNVYIGIELPRNVLTAPEALNLDTFDVIRLFFHKYLLLSMSKGRKIKKKPLLLQKVFTKRT
jgi:hypothetical protein